MKFPRLIYLILSFIIITAPSRMSADDSIISQDLILSDSISTQEVAATDTMIRKDNFIKKIIRYFDETNKPHEEKAIDYSFIGGPAYSADTKLSFGILGAALYKSVRFDSLTPQSNATIYSNFSITGYYLVGIRGDHIGPKDGYRLHYKVAFSSMPTKFWGIGYNQNKLDSNETDYLHLNAELNAAFEWKLANNLYLGPAIGLNYNRATDNDDWALWNGESLRTLNYGIGLNFSYDSRDNITAPERGWFVGMEQRFYPRFMGNDYAFSSTELTVNKYVRGWKGAIIAGQVHGRITYGDTPWGMLAQLGGGHSMRGYYEGRYRDKCALDCTLELRQHVWRRNSVVAWIGAGSVFPKFSNLHSGEILPNFGVGYRWEFKKHVNVRFDIGFGKGEKGFEFNINEAF